MTASNTPSLTPSRTPVWSRHAYWTAGNYSISYEQSKHIDKLDLPSGTKGNLLQTLYIHRAGATGLEEKYNGYIVSGYNESGELADFDGIQFYADTVFNIASELYMQRKHPTGLSSETTGFICGGIKGNEYLDTITHFIFATTTIEAGPSSLSEPTENMIGTSFTDKGYMFSGIQGNSNPIEAISSKNIESLIFSTVTSRRISTQLNDACIGGTAVRNQDNAYLIGGLNDNWKLIGKTTRFNTSIEANLELAQSLTTDRAYLCGSSSDTIGFVGGGSDSFLEDIVDQFVFATETIETTSITLKYKKNDLTSVQTPI